MPSSQVEFCFNDSRRQLTWVSNLIKLGASLHQVRLVVGVQLHSRSVGQYLRHFHTVFPSRILFQRFKAAIDLSQQFYQARQLTLSSQISGWSAITFTLDQYLRHFYAIFPSRILFQRFKEAIDLSQQFYQARRLTFIKLD